MLPRVLFFWRHWPIVVKLAIILAVIALVPLVLVSAYNDTTARAEILSASRAQILQRARGTASALDAYFAERLGDVRMVAALLDVAQFLQDPQDARARAHAQQALNNMQHVFAYSDVFLLNPNGNVVLSAGNRMLGKNLLTAPYFREAIAGNIGFDEPRYDSLSAQVNLHFYSPVRTSGVIIGALIASVALEPIDRLVQADTDFYGHRAFGVLWDDQGIRLSNGSHPDLRFVPLAPLPQNTLDALVAESRFGPETAERLRHPSPMQPALERGKLLLYDPSTDPHLHIETAEGKAHAALVPLRSKRWVYGIFTPEETLLADVNAQRTRTILATLGASALAILAALGAARWLAHPIRQIANAANALAAGDRTRRVVMEQRDEIGQLAANFNAMADAIAEKETQLRAYAINLEQIVQARTAGLREQTALTERHAEHLALLNAAALRIQQHLDPREIFRVVCDELTRLGVFTTILRVTETGAEHIHTSMSAERLQEFVATFGARQARAVFSPTILAPTTWERLRAGETIIEPMAMSRVVAAMPADDRPIGEWMLAQVQEQIVLLAPIAPTGRMEYVLGVIGGHIRESDIPTFALFARQISTALENARLFDETRQRTRELEILAEMSASLRTATNRDQVLSIILDRASALLQLDGAAISLRQAISGDNVIALASGDWAHYLGSRVPAGKGVTGHVIATGKPYVSDDFSADPLHYSPDRLGDLHAGACVPLIVPGETIGALWVGRKTGIVKSEVRLLTAIADIAANAIQRISLCEQTQRRTEQLAAVNALGRALAETLDLSEIYARAYAATTRLLPDLSTFYVALFDAERQLITATFGMREGAPVNAAELSPIPSEAPGVGTPSEAIHTRRPVIVNDLRARLEQVKQVTMGTPGPVPPSSLYAPMLAKGQVVGILSVQSDTPNRFSPDDAELLALVANTTAIAIENARLFTATARNLERIQTLRTIGVAITATMDLRVTLGLLLDHIVTRLQVDAVSIFLFEPESQVLRYAAGRGFHTGAVERLRLRLGEGLTGQVVLERRTLVVLDLGTRQPQLSAALRNAYAAEGLVAYVGVPLISKGRVKGVLEIFQRARHTLDEDLTDFLEALATQAAIAIDNAELLDNLQRSNLDLATSYDETIEGWARALDLHNKETERHAQHVVQVTLQLARAVGMSNAELQHLRYGARLHDIGMLGIPDAIVHKPGALTEEEWVIVRQHPVYAHQLLSPIKYLRPALDIPYCHHERWDGTGYPRGLQGEQIPLAARVFAVADVWDALQSERPYRAAWKEEDAREYIRANAGKHFDPQVVEKFLKMVK